MRGLCGYAPRQRTVIVMLGGIGVSECVSASLTQSHTKPETAFQSLKFGMVGKEATCPKHLRGPKVTHICCVWCSTVVRDLFE